MPSAKLVAANFSALTSVSASTSSQVLVDARAGRMGASIFNDSTATLYVNLSAIAANSAGPFTVAILAGGYYELPPPGYAGVITGVWASATGAARITELF